MVLRSTALPSTVSLDLAHLTPDQGLTLTGAAAGDELGRVIRPAGDINGDGYDDVLIGAAYSDPLGRTDAGVVYVVFGAPTLDDLGSLDLNTLDGTTGFVIYGAQANDRAGRAISSAGDVNGDGYDDILVGTVPVDPDATPSAVWVVYGGATVGQGGSVDLASLDGPAGVAIVGDAIDGVAISGAGDLNGDGYDDLAIGVPLASPDGVPYAGATYLLWGGPNLGLTLDVDTLTAAAGMVLTGPNPGDTLGRFARNLGDVNGDGYDDVALGSPTADPQGRRSGGIAYVVFGAADLGTAPLDLASLDGSNGFAIAGAAPGHLAGRSVSGAGDVNGDGYTDLLIGSPGAQVGGMAWAGAAYLVWGGPVLGAGGELDLATLGPGGVVLLGAAPGDLAGSLVSGAGDVNGDGYDDLLVASPGQDHGGAPNAGSAYLVWGGPHLSDLSALSLGHLTDATGLTLLGADGVGDGSPWDTPIFVTGLGDINGDGWADVAVGDSTYDALGQPDTGLATVVFGGSGLGGSR